MTLKIRNNWHYKGCYKGNDWWEWEAFIDDNGSGELSNINYVEYILHPTYSFPVQKITNPQGGFILKGNGGYGMFELKAFVFFNNGKMLKLTHDLFLACDPTDGTSDTKTIVNSEFRVWPRRHHLIRFNIPFQQANLSGYFEAIGGVGNDIDVLVIDDSSYFNWINDIAVPAYYYGRKMITDRIFIFLSKGNYYLIYSNRFSIISTKKVTTKIDIIY